MIISSRPFHSTLGSNLDNGDDRLTGRLTNSPGLSVFNPVLLRSMSMYHPVTTRLEYPSLSFPGSAALIRRLHTRNHIIKRNFSIMDDATRKSEREKENDSSPVSSNAPDPETKTGKAMTKGRGLVQKYGYTFVATYLGVYVVTLGALFTGLDSGLIDPVSITSIELPWHATGVEEGDNVTTDKEDFESAVDFVVSYMKKFPWTAPYTDVVSKNPHMANLGLAWVATKLTEPIRLPVSIAIVRKIKKEN